ncbi:MAG: DNA alkylation repair protein [Anaerolineae bacterium]
MTKFKDYFDEALTRRTAASVREAYTGFDAEGFTTAVTAELDALEMTDRIALMAAELHARLPTDYPAALDILRAIMPPELPTDSTEGVLESPEMWVIAHFVQVYGREHYAESMAMMRPITKRFSAEFAIRPYIEQQPQRTLATLLEWTTDPNVHVRRLTSEGTRPRLPWASRLQVVIDEPGLTRPILDALRADPEQYVRRSVANHLNDLTKDHPDYVLDLLRTWNTDPSPPTGWITKHALRTMVKAGHPDALALLGFEPPRVEVVQFRAEPETIRIGESVTLSAKLTADIEQALMIDYAVHHVRANGSARPKVFKLTEKTIRPGERLHITKTHSMRRVTIRTYYPGEHRIDLQINGKVVATTVFTLEA